MAKRASISQPAVIQTELRPLDESFWISGNSQLEQWYYQNTSVFAPDRQITPLKLTPHLSAIDEDTSIAYTPTFAVSAWYVKEWDGTQWVTTTVTAQSPASAYSFDQDGITLVVSKNNYDATHAINITCRATYNDPRDSGVQRTVEDSVMLVTSIDATQAFPNIAILNPSARMYNPLKDDSPIFEFEGSADWEGVEAQGGTAITEYKSDALGTEEIIQNNEEVLVNAAPLLNIKYGDIEKSDQQFMYRQTADGTVETVVGGVAAIDNIKGSTVKWNQTFTPYIGSSTQNGITMSGNGDGWITITNNNATSFCQIGIPLKNLVSGHIYCCRGWNYSTNKIEINNSTVFQGSSSSNPWILPCTVNGSATMNVYAAKTTPSCKIALQLFDLTLMFGAGNEPSTVAAFETWLATNIGLKDYYPYTAGQLINYGGYSVKWNQLVNITTTTRAGVTITKNSNGSYTVSGSASTPLYISLTGGAISSSQSHRIFVKVRYTTSQTATIYDQGNAAGSTYISTDKSVVYTATNAPNLTLQRENGITTDATFFVMLIDLTQMFGAGNEPDLEWCNKYLSRDYYDYCPAMDRNIMEVMEIKGSGFNVWDEEWESGVYTDGVKTNSSDFLRSKNYVKVSPNTQYYYKVPVSNSRVFFYDANKTVLDSSNSIANQVFTTPYGCEYITFFWLGTTYSNNVCINLSDVTRNGTYEPYNVQYKALPMGMNSKGVNLFDEKYLCISRNLDGSYVLSNLYLSNTNPIKAFPNQTYCVHIEHPSRNDCQLYFLEWDASLKLITRYRISNPSVATNTVHTAVMTTSSNAAYIGFFLYSGTGWSSAEIAVIHANVNISDPDKNGTYEPHWESFSDMSWITKIGIENFNMFDNTKMENGYISNSNGKVVDGDYYNTGFIAIEGGENYYFYDGTNGEWGAFYDASKQFVSGLVTFGQGDGVFTTPSNARYVRITLIKNANEKTTLNKSIPHFNGRYYPHGMTAPYFPNGLCNAGNVYDEVKVENGKIKGVVRFGCVDLGEQNYDYISGSSSNYNFFASIAGSSTYKQLKEGGVIASVMYKNDSVGGSSGGDLGCYLTGDNRMRLRNLAYTSAATFKAAMQGVPIIYELKDPYEFEIDYPTKGQFVWCGVNGSGTEVPIDQLPVYSQAVQPSGYGQGTSRININALYGEEIPVILRVKRYPWSQTVLPPKETKSVAWKIPSYDTIVVSDKGTAVRAQNTSSNFTFSTIINQQGDVITDEKKAENMVFDWYYVKYGSNGAAATPQSLGSGLTKTVSAATLKNTTPASGAAIPSTNVYCETFVLGAYHLVNGTYQRTKE